MGCSSEPLPLISRRFNQEYYDESDLFVEKYTPLLDNVQVIIRS